MGAGADLADLAEDMAAQIHVMSSPFYLVVTPFFPSPDNWRGAYCYDFVVALKKTGLYRVEVFVPGKGDDYQIGNVQIHRFVTRELPSNVFPFLWARRNKRSFLDAVKRAGISMNDVAVCHGHTANFAIYPQAVKDVNESCITLLHHHDRESFGLNLGILKYCWPYNMVMFPILRRLHEQMDCHVFISEASRRSFLAAPNAKAEPYKGYHKQMRGLPYHPARIKKSLILHNGVDVSIFNEAGRIARTDGDITIGCVGNFGDWKNQITLLKAMVVLREWGLTKIRAIFIGSGPELEECRCYAKQNCLDAEFRQEVRHECLPDFYRTIDLFVLPSFFEGFGCVFTEAYACGTPFITCEGQGMDDLIPGSEWHIWLAKIQDPDDLARKIRYYFEKHPVQHLAGPISFDELIPPFVEQVMTIARESAACNGHLLVEKK